MVTLSRSWLQDFKETPSIVPKIERAFVSDTLTYPSDAMLETIRTKSSHGDNVMMRDEAVVALEKWMANETGKEAALFASSGTMTNQLGIRAQLQQPPYSVLLDKRAHVYLNEAGGLSAHSGALPITVKPSNGHHLTLEDIEPDIVLGDDVHTAPTKIVSLENTLAGMVFPQDEIKRISDYVHKHGIILHCDGARIWEASAKTGLSLKELCEPFDSVSLCLSKGIGAPVGSVLVGTHETIKKARWFQKQFGGGTRQVGMLAVAAQYAIDNHFPLLERTHAYAREIATFANEHGIRVTLPTETNMCWLDVTTLGVSHEEFVKRAAAVDLTLLPSRRVVFHHQLSRSAVDDLKKLTRDLSHEYQHLRVPLTPEQRAASDAFAIGEYAGIDIK